MANDLMALLMAGQGGQGQAPQRLAKDQQQPFDEGQFSQALMASAMQGLGQNPIDKISLWQAQEQQRKVAANPDWYAYWNQRGGDVPPLPGENSNRPIADQMAQSYSLTGDNGQEYSWAPGNWGIKAAAGQGGNMPWLDPSWMDNARKLYTQYGSGSLEGLF